MNANTTEFSGTGLVVTLRVPCNSSEATVVAILDLRNPEDKSAIAQPPDLTIDTPDEVPCSGAQGSLAATADDRDGDLDGVRWRVDGMLIAPGTTSIPFTGPHVLRATAEDSRGARTTEEKAVTCAP